MSGQTNRSMPSPRLLDALGVACLVLAVTLLFWPASAAVHPVVPTLPAAQTGGSEVATGASALTAHALAWLDTSTTQIVEGNVFSASRRAPTVRFVPPGAEATDAPPMVSTAMPDASIDAGNTMDDAASPRLFGIIAQDGRRRALLQLPGADSVPRLLDVGDRRAGYRVLSITADRVVLVSSTGSRTLRLASRTPPDSLENLP